MAIIVIMIFALGFKIKFLKEILSYFSSTDTLFLKACRKRLIQHDFIHNYYYSFCRNRFIFVLWFIAWWHVFCTLRETNECLILIFITLRLSSSLNSVDQTTDDMIAQKEKNKLLQEEMEATLQDIQNM